MRLTRFLFKVARLQEYMVSPLACSFKTQRFQRVGIVVCVEKVAQKCSKEADDARNLLIFTGFFEGRTRSSNPSFSAHEKQSDGCFFRSRESGFEAALGGRNISTSYPFLPQNLAFPSCILTSIRYNLVELMFEIMF